MSVHVLNGHYPLQEPHCKLPVWKWVCNTCQADSSPFTPTYCRDSAGGDPAGLSGVNEFLTICCAIKAETLLRLTADFGWSGRTRWQ